MKFSYYFIFLALLMTAFGILSFTSFSVIAVSPTGANVTEISTETAPSDTPGSDLAAAGNLTEMRISGFSTTEAWQGYFGNITGAIQLADAQDNVFYNWSLATPDGEIFASTNQTVQWANIQCLNFTSTGSLVGDTVGGATSVNGTNLSQLEIRFNIVNDDVDGVNETFSVIHNHDAFVVASLSFSANECPHVTRIFGDTGAGVDGEFEEVLMYEPVTTSVVFTSIIENNLGGFDQGAQDFEMMVLEDGHSGNTATTTYYFFVELT